MNLGGMANALCDALLHSLWQGALVAGVFWLVQRRAWLGAKGRHDLGCLLLGLVSLTFVVVLMRGVGGTAPDLPELAGYPHAGSPASSGAHEVLAASPATPSAAWPSWAKLLIGAGWLGGCTTLLLRSALGLWVTRRLTAQTELPLPAAVSRCAQTLIRELGLRHATRVIASSRAIVPYTYGWIAPVVVVPIAAIIGLDAIQVQLLLRHELVHVLRKDYLYGALQSVAESLLFFHPLVWWLSRQIRQEREAACDCAVLDHGVAPLTYARALTALEALRHDIPAPALKAVGGDMTRRIQSILRANPRHSGVAWIPLLIGLGLAGLLAACTMDVLGPESTPEPAGESSSQAEAVQIAWLPPDVSRFRSEIEAAAEAHRVDAELLSLMVLVESGGDPLARSPMGSLGLLQLMPATARQVAERAGIEPPSGEALMAVPLNLDLGARLMAELLNAFADRDPVEQRRLALSGYNAGSRAVRAQLEAGTPLPKETVRYVSLLEALYRERGQATSPTYEAWRQRVMNRAASHAIVPLPAGHVTSGFGPRWHPIEHRVSLHEGVDLADRPGALIRVPLAGVVLEAADRGDARGLYVVIRHRANLETFYHHLGTVTVKAGQSLAAGDPLGTVGNTGASTGPHLHFELRDQGRPVDPSRMLESR